MSYYCYKWGDSIKDGRHPVIETLLKQELFIPNDVVLNHSEEEFILITGPNMAGKSTYMRQVALLMIMALNWLIYSC